MENERTKRKEARREAMKIWVAENAKVGIEIEPPDRVDFMDGFDAGYAAALARTDWKRIESAEDYPTAEKLYMVTTVRGVVREAFWSERKEIWVTYDGGEGFDVVAYKELEPPYTAPQPVQSDGAAVGEGE